MLDQVTQNSLSQKAKSYFSNQAWVGPFLLGHGTLKFVASQERIDKLS